MTIRLLFWAMALILFLAPTAQASDATYFPNVLIDNTCTDSFDTPGNGSGSVRPAIQTSGSGDGYCDHDSRILEGAVAADTVFTVPAKPGHCYMILAYATAATGGDTKWRINILTKNTATGAARDMDSSALLTGNTNGLFIVGSATAFAGTITEVLTVPVTNPMYVELDLNTATSWTGNISLHECG